MLRIETWAIPALWAAWCLCWLWTAWDVKATIRREPLGSRLTHIVPVMAAVWLLALPSLPGLDGRFLPRQSGLFWVAIPIVAAGLGFTIWARLILGRNWSGTVTIKAEHELVRAGPYRFVRHPIYTGLLIALAGSAIARGEWRGLLALGIAAAAFWQKLKLEERWLGETFGPAYARYQGEVAALIPFVL